MDTIKQSLAQSVFKMSSEVIYYMEPTHSPNHASIVKIDFSKFSQDETTIDTAIELFAKNPTDVNLHGTLGLAINIIICMEIGQDAELSRGEWITHLNEKIDKLFDVLDTPNIVLTREHLQ